MSASPIHVRPVTESDIPDVLRLIRELADYEKSLDKVEATEAMLKASLFPAAGEHQVAFCLVAEETKPAGAVVGMALFFYNYSTWQAKPGLYLEDLYVTPAARGTGVGKALFRELGKVALAKNCGRVSWSCLDWNTPALDFYEKGIKATVHHEWKAVRLEGEDEIRGLINMA